MMIFSLHKLLDLLVSAVLVIRLEVVKVGRSALLCLVLLMILEVRYSKVSHTSIFLKR